MLHGNSNQNNKPHHLYVIIDKLDDSVFKYGISAKPITETYSSKRIEKQVKLLNLVDGWERFFGRILQHNIKGRIEAKRIETERINQHIKEFGGPPRGNLVP